MLVAEVAVAAQRYRIAFNLHDAMQHEMLRTDFCQHRVAHLRVNGLRQQRLVAIVLEERAHAVASQPERYRMPFVEHLHNLRQQNSIRKLHLFYFDMVLLHRMAASSLGRQCRV